MINLFLAILLGNFDSSRAYLSKVKKFEELNKYVKKENMTIQDSLERSLGDLGKHLNIKYFSMYMESPLRKKSKMRVLSLIHI